MAGGWKPSTGLDMAKIDYKKIMLNMIRLLLDGGWSVPEFEAAYYFFYVDRIPENSSLTDRDHEFFSLVHETLDWTDENPDPEAISRGKPLQTRRVKCSRPKRKTVRRSSISA